MSSTLDGIAKTFFDRLEMKVGDYCQNIDMSLREFNTVIRTRDLFASRWIRPASQIGDFDSLFERGFNAESAHFQRNELPF